MSNDFAPGPQETSNAQNFMALTAPVHLPTLVSTNGADSPHLPQPHQVKAAELTGITDVVPERQGVDFGQISYFKYIANDNDVLTKMTLVCQLSGLNAAALPGGPAGVNPRYVDDVLNAACESIEFSFGGTRLQVLKGEEMHWRMYQESTEEELYRKEKLQAAGLSAHERAELAQNDQWVYLEVPLWWTRSASQNWHQYAFQRLTRVIVHFRSVDFLLQQDQVNAKPVPKDGTLYIKNHFLRFHTVAIPESTKQIFRKQIEAQGDSGWLQLINDFQEIENQALTRGQQYATIPLNNFTKYGYNLRFVIRPAANLQPNYLNNERFADIICPRTVQMKISGQKFWPEMDAHYMKFVLNPRYYSGNPNLNILNIPFTEYPEVHAHGMGGIEFSNTTNPQLILDLGVAGALLTDQFNNPTDCRLDGWLYCHNYVRLVLKGNQSAAEPIQPLTYA